MKQSRFQDSNTPPIWEGIVFPKVDRSDTRLKMREAQPHPELAEFVQSISWLEWNIPGGQELNCIAVPNPCVKIAAVVRNLEQLPIPSRIDMARPDNQFCVFAKSGHAICFEFKPGGFFPFSEAIQATSLPRLEKISEPYLLEWIEKIENLLLKAPRRTHHLPEIRQVVETLWSPESDEIAPLTKRTQQRIFQREVGLSLRTVKQIVRINQSLKRLGTSATEALVEVALNLGYADQAHMNNEFRKLLTAKPSQFRTYC